MSTRSALVVYFNVVDNVVLSTCEATLLAEYFVGLGWVGGQTNITGNDDAGVCM